MDGLPSPAECRRIFEEERLDPRIVEHVEAVALLARRLAQAIQKRGHLVDVDLAHVGALLHDIGRSKTQGLDHAGVGAQIIRRRGLPEPLALCVERHTGGGIDLQEARALGLSPKDYTPRSVEEKIVCQTDNLFDGSRRQPLARELAYLQGQGLAHVATKVQALHGELSGLLGMDLDRLE
jgi:tRNA (cytidine56-2'-O)-methyltransferase